MFEEKAMKNIDYINGRKEPRNHIHPLAVPPLIVLMVLTAGPGIVSFIFTKLKILTKGLSAAFSRRKMVHIYSGLIFSFIIVLSALILDCLHMYIPSFSRPRFMPLSLLGITGVSTMQTFVNPFVFVFRNFLTIIILYAVLFVAYIITTTLSLWILTIVSGVLNQVFLTLWDWCRKKLWGYISRFYPDSKLTYADRYMARMRSAEIKDIIAWKKTNPNMRGRRKLTWSDMI